jgi:hypothetical protein
VRVAIVEIQSAHRDLGLQIGIGFPLGAYSPALFGVSAGSAISKVWTMAAIESGPVHASGSRLALHAHRPEARASDNDGGDYGGEDTTVETGNHLSDFFQFRAQAAKNALIAPIGNPPNLKAKAPYGGCVTEK